MHLLGIRFCTVSRDAEGLALFLDRLGLQRMQAPAGEEPAVPASPAPFWGAIFPAGDSWIEMWPEGPDMQAGIMLQLVVDDADAFAAHARENGLEPEGPVDEHGERIYFLQAPTGLCMSFQSRLEK